MPYVSDQQLQRLKKDVDAIGAVLSRKVVYTPIDFQNRVGEFVEAVAKFLDAVEKTARVSNW